jgi:hypothetical protein
MYVPIRVCVIIIPHSNFFTNSIIWLETIMHYCETETEFLDMHKVVLNSTEELHLSEFSGTTSHPDMQKIRITGYFFENRLHWQFEAEKSLQTTILVYVFNFYLWTNKTLFE